MDLLKVFGMGKKCSQDFAAAFGASAVMCAWITGPCGPSSLLLAPNSASFSPWSASPPSRGASTKKPVADGSGLLPSLSFVPCALLRPRHALLPSYLLNVR
jgi:hypothetical protein